MSRRFGAIISGHERHNGTMERMTADNKGHRFVLANGRRLLCFVAWLRRFAIKLARSQVDILIISICAPIITYYTSY